MSEKEVREYGVDDDSNGYTSFHEKRGRQASYDGLDERRKSVALNIVENPLKVCDVCSLDQSRNTTTFGHDTDAIR